MRRSSTLLLRLVCGTAVFFFSASASAAELFVDPVNGSQGGDGSAAKPWQSLDQLVADGLFGTAVKAGDTVWLRSGYHGAPTFSGGDYTPPITLAAAPGETPQASSVTFSGTKGWTVRGLSISPSFGPTPTVANIVLIDKQSARVTVEDSQIFSVADSSAWGADEWINVASSGMFIRGADCVARNNELTNVRFGISVEGRGALVEKNSVVGFSADGMRGLGDDGVFQYNVVKDVHVSQADGDDNHDDGFQSWSIGADGNVGTGVVKNVTLRGNIFVNREDPDQPLTNSMQGIGCFDGFFEGWVVENNVVATDHWHGISFYGLRSSRIVNNTVVDVNDVTPGPPWIKVAPHKDGTPSQDVVVRNNLATDYQIEGANVTDDHNTTLQDLTMFFLDPAKLDLHLLPGCPAVDAGSADMAPPLDLERIPRPQGAGFDLGAYEWHEPGIGPGGSGGSGGSGGLGGGGGSVQTGGASSTGGSGGSGDGSGSGTGQNASCGCRVAEERAPHPSWIFAGLSLAFLRRRRRGSTAARV